MENKKISGWNIGFADLTISELYEDYPGLFNNSSILITCLDSSRDLNILWKWIAHLEENRITFKKIGSGFWFDKSLVNLLFNLKKTFFHFDEVYLFDNNNQPKFYPEHSFTTDAYNFSESIPQEFVTTLTEIGAIGYLSDGCGLNFAYSRDIDLNKIRDIERRRQ